MLNSNEICDTLLAVEEVEVSFARTLRNINNINHRFNVISALKRKAAKVQESFESEIQAAITEPTLPKGQARKSFKNRTLPLVGKNRVNKDNEAKIPSATLTEVKNLPKKSLKKRISPLVGNKRIIKGNKAKTKRFTESPRPALPPIPYKECVPQMVCLHATNRTYEIHNAPTQIVTRRPYGDLIRGLYRAARRRTQQEAMHQQDYDQCPDCSICRCSCSPCCLVCR